MMRDELGVVLRVFCKIAATRTLRAILLSDIDRCRPALSSRYCERHNQSTRRHTISRVAFSQDEVEPQKQRVCVGLIYVISPVYEEGSMETCGADPAARNEHKNLTHFRAYIVRWWICRYFWVPQ